jgi:esterase
LGWQKINLVGHSMGGRNSMTFSVKYPERVQSLVIEDIGPEANLESLTKIAELVEGVPTPFHDRHAAREYFTKEFPRVFAHRYKVNDLAQYLHANIVETETGEADWRFSKTAILDSVRFGRNKDRWDEIQAISCPTLLIRGELTDELSPEVYERMLKTNPKINGVQIPNAAHWVHFDQPEKFIETLKDFLDKCQV